MKISGETLDILKREQPIKKLLILSVAIHVIAAWFSIGRFHADEHFQILEFAAYKANINPAEIMPWEFHEQIRPTLQVVFAYVIIKTTGYLGLTDPFVQTFLMRLFFSLLGLYASFILLKKVRSQIRSAYDVFFCILSLVWCFIPWLHVRFSSESVAATFFLIGFSPLLDPLFFEKTNKSKNIAYFALFLSIGVSGVIRFQMNFFTVGLFLWLLFVKQEKLKYVLVASLGIFGGIVLGCISDRWFYGKWISTTWNYLYQNIVLHKAEQFGKESVFFYFEKSFLDAIPPFSLLIILSVLYFFVVLRKSPITWILVPFLLAHFLSPHKELRFLFPLIPFIPFIVILSYQDLRLKLKNKPTFLKTGDRLIKVFKFPFYVINFIMLVYLSFKPADDYSPLLRFLYTNYNESKSQLFYLREDLNPYKNAVSLNFYRSPSIKTAPFSKEDLVKSSDLKNITLFLTDVKSPTSLTGEKYTLVYSSIPKWLEPFNFNNWQERTHPIYIYEVFL